MMPVELHEATPADEYVFPGCPLKLEMSAVPIMMFILYHKLSLKTGQDLIELLAAHFPYGHRAMTSLYRLKSYWRKRCQQSEHVRTLVCSSCDSLLKRDESCHRAECLAIGSPTTAFLMLDIRVALEQLFRGMTLCMNCYS